VCAKKAHAQGDLNYAVKQIKKIIDKFLWGIEEVDNR
jgi:hypothetical protein